MRYTVSYDGAPAQSSTEGTNEAFELADALAHACRLLDEGRRAIAIRDDAGHAISGDALAACCRGEMKIAADLTAVKP